MDERRDCSSWQHAGQASVGAQTRLLHPQLRVCALRVHVSFSHALLLSPCMSIPDTNALM